MLTFKKFQKTFLEILVPYVLIRYKLHIQVKRFFFLEYVGLELFVRGAPINPNLALHTFYIVGSLEMEVFHKSVSTRDVIKRN